MRAHLAFQGLASQAFIAGMIHFADRKLPACFRSFDMVDSQLFQMVRGSPPHPVELLMAVRQRQPQLPCYQHYCQSMLDAKPSKKLVHPALVLALPDMHASILF